ncbi:MAG: CopG family transcriptional regulator [Acidilobus sp.]
MSQERVQVSIPRDIYEKAKRYVDEQGTFSSVEELVEFLLRQLLEEQETSMSKEDEEAVRDRLRRLGYL